MQGKSWCDDLQVVGMLAFGCYLVFVRELVFDMFVRGVDDYMDRNKIS